MYSQQRFNYSFRFCLSNVDTMKALYNVIWYKRLLEKKQAIMKDYYKKKKI